MRKWPPVVLTNELILPPNIFRQRGAPVAVTPDVAAANPIQHTGVAETNPLRTPGASSASPRRLSHASMSPLLAPPLPSCLPSSTSCATFVWMCFFSSLHFFSLFFLLLADCQTPCPAFSNYTRSPALRSALLQPPPTPHHPSTLVFSAALHLIFALVPR